MIGLDASLLQLKSYKDRMVRLNKRPYLKSYAKRSAHLSELIRLMEEVVAKKRHTLSGVGKL